MSDPTCPFCGAGAVQRVGQWGGQIITAQWRCRACGSYFEAVRDAFDDEHESADMRKTLNMSTESESRRAIGD